MGKFDWKKTEDMKTFFLIDDDSDDRMIFQEALECLQLPVNYIEAIDGQHALEMIREEKIGVPDVIFLDLNMPRVGGYEVLLNVKQLSEYQSVPVFMYTTSSSQVDKDKCMQAGAAGFMTKQDSFDDLCKELNLLVKKM